ncbi:MAG: hypothetical protein JJE15_15400, partial [Desulfobacteraceae bacterium]|nr:hypothetical protein [Desulfobacteraceae bacterium]
MKKQEGKSAMEEEIKEQEDQKEEQAVEKPLDKMTAKELREIAKEIPGVTGAHAMKKEQLLVIIKEDRGIKDEEPAKKKSVKSTLSAKELKEKIAQLKVDKAAAREVWNRKEVNRLRRRINRLKKRTRKVA